MSSAYLKPNKVQPLLWYTNWDLTVHDYFDINEFVKYCQNIKIFSLKREISILLSVICLNFEISLIFKIIKKLGWLLQ